MIEATQIAPAAPDTRSILWHSVYAGVKRKTGYAGQSAVFLPRLRDAGFRVGHSTFSGVELGSYEWEGLPVFTKHRDDFGNDCLPDHAAHFFGGDPRDGLLITLMDIWKFEPSIMRQLNWAPWLPIDSTPAMPAVVQVLKASQAVPIAYSRFGEARLKEAGVPVLYVPHGIPTGTYAPGDRTAARERLGLPVDGFIAGAVAANLDNPSRKCWPEILDAWARFVAQRKKNDPPVYLYLHTDIRGDRYGVELPLLLEQLGIPPETIIFVSNYAYFAGAFGDAEMVDLYNAFDVLLMPSRGEGFGLPIIESASCGTPAIVTDDTSMPELIAPGTGWKVPGQRFYAAQQAWQTIPSVPGIVAALGGALELWRKPKNAAAVRAKCREFALGYDADLVLRDYWVPTLERIFEAIGKAKAHQTSPTSAVSSLEARAAELTGNSGGYSGDSDLTTGVPALIPQAQAAIPQVGLTVGEGVAPLTVPPDAVTAYLAQCPDPEFYDLVAERDRSMERGEADRWYNEHRFEAALRLLSPRRWSVTAPQRVVDLGCAEGEFLAILRQDSGLELVGVDISPRRVRYAAERYPDVSFEVGDVCSWGEPAAWDWVICLETIEHVEQPETLLANAFRILVPNGYLLLATPNDPDGKLKDGREHRHAFGPEALIALALGAGFKVEDQAGTLPGIYGPDGLLSNPDRLPEYQFRAERCDWNWRDGSNLYLLLKKPGPTWGFGRHATAPPPARATP